MQPGLGHPPDGVNEQPLDSWRNGRTCVPGPTYHDFLQNIVWFCRHWRKHIELGMNISLVWENRSLQGDGDTISRVFLAVEVALGRDVAMTRRRKKQ